MNAADLGSVKGIQGEARRRMDKALEDLRGELAALRTGRASVHLLDSVKVDYYGTPTPLNQLATLSAPEATMISVQVWDVSQIGAVEKAIRAADLGLNPQNDGKLIRVPVPPLTEERRKELVKHLHHVAENHRVAVRNIRRDANEQVKKLAKDKKISEDEDRRAHDDVQRMTDDFIKKIDELSKAKEQEILKV
jgi:ribosome recycling factor